ncbi:uncharacterized protein [Ptychodera flava]|uniref:uncharacterized protein n=1 Tax=Ptychodera flava TaxID=63121 RepID=UPI003969EFEF
MASSILQPLIDKENPDNIKSGKNRLASTSSRPISGKTFAGNTNSLVTPRKALGNVNIDPGLRTAPGSVKSTAKKTAPTQMKKPALHSRTPAPHKSAIRLPSFNTPSLQGLSVKRKTKTKTATQKQASLLPVDDFPDVEYMPDYKEDDWFTGKDDLFDVWGEDGRPSASLIFRKSCRMIPRMKSYKEEQQEYPDLSKFDLETMMLPKTESVSDVEDELFSMEDFAKGIEFKDLDPVEIPDITQLLL